MIDDILSKEIKGNKERVRMIDEHFQKNKFWLIDDLTLCLLINSFLIGFYSVKEWRIELDLSELIEKMKILKKSIGFEIVGSIGFFLEIINEGKGLLNSQIGFTSSF